MQIDKSVGYGGENNNGLGSRARNAFVSVLIGYAVILAFTIISSAALMKYSDPARIYNIISLLALIAGAFAGGFSHAKTAKRGAVLRGLESGAMMGVIAVIISLAIPGGDGGGLAVKNIFIRLLIIIACSVAGGVLTTFSRGGKQTGLRFK